MKNGGVPARRMTSPTIGLIVVDVEARAAPRAARSAGEQRARAARADGGDQPRAKDLVERAAARDERVGAVEQILRRPELRLPAGEDELLRRPLARQRDPGVDAADERGGDRLRCPRRSSPTRRRDRRDTGCAASSRRARRSSGRGPRTAGPAPTAATDPSGTAGPAPARIPARRTDRPGSARRCAGRLTGRERRAPAQPGRSTCNVPVTCATSGGNAGSRRLQARHRGHRGYRGRPWS